MEGVAELAVRVEGLGKVYRSLFGLRRHEALKGVSFAVRRGEVVGLIGPNGGGKSTAMRCMLGFLRPSAGAVTVLGRPAGDREALARLGYLPEESPFPGVLTAEAAMELYGRLAGLARGERRRQAGALLERVGLGAHRRRRLGHFSKGMLRRFGVAQAMLGQPELLILDEPTSGLDPLGARELREIVAEERARGASVLLSSHALAELERVCDGAVMLHEGRVLAAGPLEELLARPDGGRRTLDAFFLEAVRGPEAAAAAARAPEGAAASGAEGEA